jgi:UDP-N-acetylmuramoyl-L-alanyl-D-glutamate--2,6-diaminopimelate ligase
MMAAAIAAMTLGELFGVAAGQHTELAVSDLVSDSRQVTLGAAFVALEGARVHGLDFADQALAAGAAVVIYDARERQGARPIPAPALAVPGLRARLGDVARRFYGEREPSGALIGITGTNGKTTVAWLIAQASSSLGHSCGYVGTLGYGQPGALNPHALTTPDCLSLHRELAGLDTERAVLEVSSHALDQDRVAGLDFNLAAFTNLSRDHLDWHASMEAYFEAKAKLFTGSELEAAIVNIDDAYGRALSDRLRGSARIVSVSHAPGNSASLEGRGERLGLAGLALDVAGEFGHTRIESPLIGSFNIENLLVALGVLVASGDELDDAGQALALAAAPPGRLEVFGGPPGRPWVVVDYAHTPSALERTLAELNAISSGAITCVFGCGGERDRGKRALMGEAAARYAAHIVLTDDNPRGEDAAAIVADIKAGIARHPDVKVEHSRELAIVEAIRAAAADDIVLVAGKGHETVQQTASAARPFDDRALVASVLGGMA